MSSRGDMSVKQTAFAWGIPVGLFAAVIPVLGGMRDDVSTTALLTDALVAFLVAGLVAGLLGGFIRWRQLARRIDDAPPPGWYNSPDDDGTQWFWSGAQWTERTRKAEPQTAPRWF